MQTIAPDATESLLDRNRQLQAVLARIEALLADADQVSTSPSMTVHVAEVRAAIAGR